MCVGFVNNCVGCPVLSSRDLLYRCPSPYRFRYVEPPNYKSSIYGLTFYLEYIEDSSLTVADLIKLLAVVKLKIQKLNTGNVIEAKAGAMARALEGSCAEALFKLCRELICNMLAR